MTLDEQIALSKRSIEQIKEWQAEQREGVANNYDSALAFETARLAELERFRDWCQSEERRIAEENEFDADPVEG